MATIKLLNGYGTSILAIVVAIFATGCTDFGGGETYAYDKEEVATAMDNLGIVCDSLADCQPYEVCIKNCTMECRQHRCKIIALDTENGDDIGDAQCIIDVHDGLEGSSSNESDSSSQGDSSTVSSSDEMCGKVDPPPEEVAKHGSRHANCDRDLNAWAGRDVGDAYNIRAWADVVADTSGSTIEIISFTLYGVRSDNTSVPVLGTAAGDSTVTWAGSFSRSPWFVPTNPLSSYDVESTYTVPTGTRLLHFGNGGFRVGSYTDFYVVGVFKTTGDVKVKVGADAYLSGDRYGWELGNSNWYSCNDGGEITVVSYNPVLSDPCSNKIGHLASSSSGSSSSNGGSTTTTTPVTTSSDCPSTGIKVTPGSSLLSNCPNGLRIVTWDDSGNTLQSPVGGSLYTDPDYYGFNAVTSVCNGVYRTGLSDGSSAISAGYAQVCSQGRDITSKTVVCDGKLSVAINPAEAGQCN